jgi:hypothetical protein
MCLADVSCDREWLGLVEIADWTEPDLLSQMEQDMRQQPGI